VLTVVAGAGAAGWVVQGC